MLLSTSKPSIFSHSSQFPTSKSPNSTKLHQISSFSRKPHFKTTKFTPKFSTTDDSIASIQENDEPDPNEDELDDGVEIEIEKIGKNKRRIRSKIQVDATLQHVWDVLTDYEKLSDFIPSLAVNQLLEKRDKFARLFQIGEQNLAFGIKFNAKGIVDCFENDLESLPSGQRRDIEFNMIEGDFKLFKGKWSIEQNTITCEQSNSSPNQEFQTTLSYVVDVEPKLWLPVRLVEGRLCREISINLSSIGKEAQRTYANTLSTL
ncbi:Ribosome association toxin RatA [Heracleum sosnowskyi]|uniref:Ribosome association toxin RatA n=1 Tax=Heracleum sosnowskyi TaxID=360622 RepID=A0AAD8N7G5_9APIA|nr:Ribosome association toxin RatA [Heracleum sosnowskyi]